MNAKIHGEIHPSIVSCCDWLRLVCLQLGKPFDAEKYGIRRNKVQVELDKLGIAAGADRVVDYWKEINKLFLKIKIAGKKNWCQGLFELNHKREKKIYERHRQGLNLCSLTGNALAGHHLNHSVTVTCSLLIKIEFITRQIV